MVRRWHRDKYSSHLYVHAHLVFGTASGSSTADRLSFPQSNNIVPLRGPVVAQGQGDASRLLTVKTQLFPLVQP